MQSYFNLYSLNSQRVFHQRNLNVNIPKAFWLEWFDRQEEIFDEEEKCASIPNGTGIFNEVNGNFFSWKPVRFICRFRRVDRIKHYEYTLSLLYTLILHPELFDMNYDAG